MANSLLSMWDDVVSTVTEGIDFALLPMPPLKEPPTSLELSDDDHSAAGGPPPLHPMDSSRMAVDGTESSPEHSATSPYDECDFADELDIESDTTTQGAPPPPPPPGPPPPPMVAIVDPHAEAKQKISRLVLRLKGVSESKQLKKTGETEGVLCLDYDELDAKGKQWADFNARGHKLRDGKEFIVLANKERMKIDKELEKLADKTNDGVMTLEDLNLAAEVLETAGNWYHGGVKGLKESRPLYGELEGMVESMVEFITLRGEMIELPCQHHCEGDEQDLLLKTKAEFEKKNKRWGIAITSRAKTWRVNRFPVCERLLRSANDYMCRLVVTFVSKSLEGANKVDTKREHPKANMAKKRLEESIQLLQIAAPYFSTAQPSICTCEECSKESSENGSPTQCQPGGYLLSELLKQTVKIAEVYLELGIGQFEGYIQNLGKQKICDHFQSILGLLKKIEDLVSSLPRDEVDSLEKSMSAGIITHLPESENLKKTMKKSCESLCGHVQREATAYKVLPSEQDSDAKQEKTREMVQWMSFYCKYSYRMSIASGTSLSDHQTTVSKTVQIAFSFIEDNLEQYDTFVHVLDRKRIKAHFERIMRVIMSLVSNIPTNGSSNVDKVLNMLPNSDVLVTTVKRSCDKLLQHYQEHERNEVSLLQSVDHLPDVIEKRKKEVSKWLAFGGDYFLEMLKALGPDHTNHLMLVYAEFEKLVQRVEEI